MCWEALGTACALGLGSSEWQEEALRVNKGGCASPGTGDLPWAPGAAATLGGEKRVGSVVHRLLPRQGSWTSPFWLLRPCEHKVASLCKKGKEMKFLCASH